jgi:orotate phosphoribosyltransferase
MTDNIARNVASYLLQINAIKLSPQNPFTWASGIKSPIYCDNRLILSFPKIRTGIKIALKEACNSFGEYDLVAGVATSGIPFATLLSDATGEPMVYVRSKAKGHGRQKMTEGKFEPGQKVLVIEDLISTGGSCLKAVENLRADGLVVVGVLAIFSYGFDQAKENFAKHNCSFKTLSNFPVMLEEAIEANYIKDSDLETIQNWRQNPKQWLDTHVS